MKPFQVFRRMDGFTGIAKSGIVIGGYVVAIVLAFLAVAAYISLTDGPDRDLSSGMHAFGDALLFIFAFGAASALPTSLALHFLRAVKLFWWSLCVVAFMVAVTGLGSIVTVADLQTNASKNIWSALAAPRIYIAPLLAAFFAMAGLYSPERGHRWCLTAAFGIECAASVFGFVHWFAPIIFSKGY